MLTVRNDMFYWSPSGFLLKSATKQLLFIIYFSSDFMLNRKEGYYFTRKTKEIGFFPGLRIVV